jgi:hypothetical protein
MPVALLIPLIGAAIPFANNLISWIAQATAAAKQASDLSEADLQALQTHISSATWNIDPDPVVPPGPVPPPPIH